MMCIFLEFSDYIRNIANERASKLLFLLLLLLMIIIRKTCLCNEYPFKPHFYIEKQGYAGALHIFALKHRLWVLVRTTIYVLSKNKKKYQHFSDEFFMAEKKSLYIAWASFCNVLRVFLYFVFTGSLYFFFSFFNLISVIISDKRTCQNSDVFNILDVIYP